MPLTDGYLSHALRLFCVISLVFASSSCTKKSVAQSSVDLEAPVKVPFHFIAYGDTRFHDPKDTDAANPTVRVALVKAIAAAGPAFICFTGDIVYNGHDARDWNVWDSETAIWREKNIPVYPALGNHDLHGNEKTALGNYFERFPDLKNSRYYAVRAANSLILVLDSSLDETAGPQGEWLKAKLDQLPADVDFVFIMLHHPPYTSSSDAKMFGGGHSSRSPEKKMAEMLEQRQPNTRARFVVFAGHVHNYERHEHGGVSYFVTGGGGAHAYPIERAPEDPYQSKEINYHYLLVDVDRGTLQVTMHRLVLSRGSEVWTEPDSITISVSAAKAGAAGQ
jgi:acid phosphatase type 7